MINLSTNFHITRQEPSGFDFWAGNSKYFERQSLLLPVPVAARSKAQIYGRSSAAIVGSNPTQGLDVCVL